VGSAAIAALAVGTAAIANLAVNNAKLGSLAVANANIQNGAVNTLQVQNGAITNLLVQDSAITTAKIGDLQVTSGKVASLMAGKLLADTISAAITMTAPVISILGSVGTVAIDNINGIKMTYSGAVASMGYGVFTTASGGATGTLNGNSLTLQNGSASVQSYCGASIRQVYLTNADGSVAISLVSTAGGNSINIGNGYLAVNGSQVIDSFGRLRQSYTAESIALSSVSTAGWFAAYDSAGNYRGKIPIIP
jgi:hypothetical protein